MVIGAFTLAFFPFITAWPTTEEYMPKILQRDVAPFQCPPCPPPDYKVSVIIGVASAIGVIALFLVIVKIYKKSNAYQTYAEFRRQNEFEHRARMNAEALRNESGLVALTANPRSGSRLLPGPVQAAGQQSFPRLERVGPATTTPAPQAPQPAPPPRRLQALTQSLRNTRAAATTTDTGNTGGGSQTQNGRAAVATAPPTNASTEGIRNRSPKKPVTTATTPATRPIDARPPANTSSQASSGRKTATAYKPQPDIRNPEGYTGNLIGARPPSLPAPNNSTRTPSPTKRELATGPPPPPHGSSPVTIRSPVTEGLNVPRTRNNNAEGTAPVGNAPVAPGTPRVRFASQDEIRIMSPAITESTVPSRSNTPASGPTAPQGIDWPSWPQTVEAIHEEEEVPPPPPPHRSPVVPQHQYVPSPAPVQRSPVVASQQPVNSTAPRAATSSSRPVVQSVPRENSSGDVPARRSPVRSPVVAPQKPSNRSPVRSPVVAPQQPTTPAGPSNRPSGSAQQQQQQQTPASGAKPSPAPSGVSNASSYQATVETISDEGETDFRKKELEGKTL